MLSTEEIWITILSFLPPQALSHVGAVCTTLLSLDTEEIWKVHCITAYPLTEEVKKLVPSSTWQSLYRRHCMTECMSKDEVTNILQDTESTQGSEENFNRADFRLGIQIHIENGPLVKVLVELNDNPIDDSLADYEFTGTEISKYRIPCEEYPEMKLRVWLYCIKNVSVLELRCLLDSAGGEKSVDGEVNESEVITMFEINAEGMLPDKNFFVADLTESQSDIEDGSVLLTTKRINCRFYQDEFLPNGDRYGNRGNSFEESDKILNLLKWLLV